HPTVSSEPSTREGRTREAGSPPRRAQLCQATATLELLEQAPSLDALVVPVGGGGLIAGACLVAAEHDLAVYGVEPEGCDALCRSLEAGRRVAVEPGPTIADGLKPVRIGALNFAIAARHVAGGIRVSDPQIG